MGHVRNKDLHHRHHLVEINNDKEQKQLDALNTFYDKCSDMQQYEHRREENELKHELASLKREQKQRQREGSCLETSLDDDVTNEDETVKSARKLTAHDVAMRMINKDQVDVKQPQKKKTPNRPGTGKQGNTRTSGQQRSWHATNPPAPSTPKSVRNRTDSTRLPGISPRTPRRGSIDDPESHSHEARRQMAWTKKNSVPCSKDPDTVKKARSKTKKKVAKSVPSNPRVVITTSNSQTWMDKSEEESACKKKCSNSTMGMNKSVVGTSASKKSVTRKDSISKKSNEKCNTPMTPSSSCLSEFRIHRRDSSVDSGGRRRTIDQESLQHYYDLLAENERLLKEEDKAFETPTDGHGPLSTLKRSHRRKLSALEGLLMQLPSFKDQHNEMDPLECLNCGYLRLSAQNISDLEEECRQTGKDPGLHANMTEDKVRHYYENHNILSPSDSQAQLTT